MFGGLTLVSAKGIGNGARLGLLLAIMSIVPISLLAIGPMITGSFHLSNITGALWPAGWSWGIGGILTLFGLFAIAEWSTCFEGVVVFGPQYKDPGSDYQKHCSVQDLYVSSSLFSSKPRPPEPWASTVSLLNQYLLSYQSPR